MSCLLNTIQSYSNTIIDMCTVTRKTINTNALMPFILINNLVLLFKKFKNTIINFLCTTLDNLTYGSNDSDDESESEGDTDDESGSDSDSEND
jgi:hypothetical protein